MFRRESIRSEYLMAFLIDVVYSKTFYVHLYELYTHYKVTSDRDCIQDRISSGACGETTLFLQNNRSYSTRVWTVNGTSMDVADNTTRNSLFEECSKRLAELCYANATKAPESPTDYTVLFTGAAVGGLALFILGSYLCVTRVQKARNEENKRLLSGQRNVANPPLRHVTPTSDVAIENGFADVPLRRMK